MTVHYFRYLWYAERDAKKMRKMGYKAVVYDVSTLGKDIHWAVSVTRE